MQPASFLVPSPQVAAYFLAPLPGRKRRLLRGEFFAHTSFTLLLFCFTLFILPALLYIKNPKN
jgi:hypothetical protein